MNPNSVGGSRKEPAKETVSVCELTRNIIQSYANEMNRRKISVEADLCSVTADVHRAVIHSAVSQMVENAIQCMPDGGQISITLIDGQYQWELEVADSVGEICERGSSTDATLPPKTQSNPTLRIYAPGGTLNRVRNAADVHGGQVQSWVCPQGGTANVLVIPRVATRGSSARAA